MTDWLLFWLWAWMALWLSAWLTPGPQTMYMIATTLQHGLRKWLIVAATPLLAEFPVITAVAFGVASWAFPYWLIVVIWIIGGIVLIYMWYGLSKKAPARYTSTTLAKFKFSKAFLICFFNPNPYVFWMTAGVALMHQTLAAGWSVRRVIIWFFAVFLSVTCGITLFANHMKRYIASSWYQRVIHGLGYCIIVMWMLMLCTALLDVF